MQELKIGVYRNDFQNVNLAEHQARARLLHSMADTLDLGVKDWGNTDDSSSHEYVEIIAALGSAGVFTAMVSIFKAWLNRNKIAEVIISNPKGGVITLKKGTAEDVVKIAEAIGFTMEEKDQ